MKPVNLFGIGLRADSFAIASEYRTNCYYDIRKELEGAKIVVRGTPGSFPWIDIPGSPIRGARVIGQVCYVVAGATLYSVSITGVCVALGTLTTTVNRVSLSDNYAQLIIVDGAHGYIYATGTGVFSQISDVNFPNGATTVTALSGRFIVEAPASRSAYISAALDGLTWTNAGASMFIVKQQNSDLLTAVSTIGSVLILWGTSSIEYWQDAGLSPQPFQLITGSTQPYGLAAKWSPALVDQGVPFLGLGTQGGLAVYNTVGITPTKVSTSDVDDYIAALGRLYTMGDAVGFGYTVDGHSMYQITFPTANRSLIYDLNTGIWSVVQTGSALSRHYADGAVVFNSRTLFWDNSSTKLYILSPTAYDDSGVPQKRQVISKHLRNNGVEFPITELALIMDTGNVPEASDFYITLEVSRDEGRTYGSPRRRTIGKVGQYRTPRVKWDRLGSAIDFVFRFTLTDPVPFVIAGAEIDP